MQRLDSPAELSGHWSNNVMANNIQMLKKKNNNNGKKPQSQEIEES